MQPRPHLVAQLQFRRTQIGDQEQPSIARLVQHVGAGLRADFVVRFAHVAPCLCASEDPFLLADLSIFVEVEAREQGGLVAFPRAEKVADVLLQVKVGVFAADGGKLADHKELLPGQDQRLGAAVILPLSELVGPARQDFRILGVDQAKAAAVVEQETVVAASAFEAMPFAVRLALLDCVLVPDAGQPREPALQCAAGMGQRAAEQLHVTLRRGRNLRSRRAADRQQALQAEHPRDKRHRGDRGQHEQQRPAIADLAEDQRNGNVEAEKGRVCDAFALVEKHKRAGLRAE